MRRLGMVVFDSRGRMIKAAIFSLGVFIAFQMPTFGKGFPQFVPYIVIGGSPEEIHFQTVITVLPQDARFDDLDITLFNQDVRDPLSAVFNGQGPIARFTTRDHTVTITSPNRQFQTPQASLDTNPDDIILVRIQMFDGKDLVTELEQQALVPPSLLWVRRNKIAPPPIRWASVPLDTREAKDLGIVVWNASEGRARIRLLAREFEKPSIESDELVLESRSRLIGLATGFFRASIREKVGTLEIRADQPIVVIAVRLKWPELGSLAVLPLLRADEIHVASGFGDDTSGDGSPDRPFRTISKALAFAKNMAGFWLGQITIKASGKFTTALGESFPLVIQSNIVLEGFSSAIEGGGNFQGFNAALATERSGGMVKGFSITNPNPSGVAILMLAGGGMTLQDLKISGNEMGVYVVGPENPGGGPHLTLTSSAVHDNKTGVQLKGTTFVQVRKSAFFKNETAIELRDRTSVLLEDNTMSANRIGISIFDSADLNLFVGSGSSEGRNVIRGNTEVDLCHRGASSIQAKNNIWDNSPPSRNADCVGGTDIGGTGADKVTVN